MSETALLMDFFSYVSSDAYDGGPTQIVVNLETTQNYKTVIEQSQEDDFRSMTERELNRRLDKGQAHYRVAGLSWVYSNEATPLESAELTIEVKIRPVGVEDL